MILIKTNTKIFLATLLSKFFRIFFPKNLITNRNNLNYNLDLTEGVDLRIFLNFREERGLFNLVKLLDLNKKYNFIDVGSNVGSVSLELSKLFQNSKVYSIEPTNYAIKKFKCNLDLNPANKKRIRLYQYFIGNNSKRETYSSWKLDFKKKNKHYVHGGSKRSTNNKFITLNKFVKKIGKKIHFIKIDTDGHEFEILKSGVQFLKKDKPIIHIEFAPYLHREYGYTTNKIIKLIKNELKYEFYSESLEKINNIFKYAEKIEKTSENFFLINKKTLNFTVGEKSV